jgi:cytoplasmic polyadenylation element-binding protein
MIQQSQLNSDLDHNNDYDLNQEINDLQLEFETKSNFQNHQQSPNDLILNAAATALLNNEHHGITNKSPLMIMNDQEEEELKQLYLNELLMNNLNLNAQVYSPNSQASSSQGTTASSSNHNHIHNYPLSAIGSPRPNSNTATIDINNNILFLSPVSHYALAGGLSQLTMTPKTPSHHHQNNNHQLQELLWNTTTNQNQKAMTPPPSANQQKSTLFTSLNQNNQHNMNDESLFTKEFNLNPLANSFQHHHSPRSGAINSSFGHNQTYTAGEFNFNSNVFNNNNKLNETSLVNGFRSSQNTHSKNNHHNYNSFHDSKSWSGRLPPKIYSTHSIYSRKVFLGGLPWDVNQQYLLQLLHQYGQVKLEIPGKDQKHPRVSTKTQERNTPGYVYIIFENENSVQRLLGHCRKELKNGGEHFYYNIAIPTFSTTPQQHQYFPYGKQSQQQRQVTGIKTKEVEVIPWNQDDTSYVPQSDSIVLPSKIDSKCTIFVGALHGMLNAQGLAKVMSEVFGEAIHAGLDTDKYKYPIGSGRVTFRNRASYVKAIKAKFVTISANQSSNDPSPKFEKTIQIDPYLEDAKCCMCQAKSVYFCRNEYCLGYYCQACWQVNHDRSRGGEHQGMCRQNKTTHNF